MRYGVFLIKNKFSGKYLCWNSFKAAWYWDGKANSEIFGLNDKRAERLLKEIEGGKLVFSKCNKDDALVVEWN